MKANTKTQNEVRAAKRGDKNGVSFTAVATDNAKANEFGNYITHLAPAGVRKPSVTIDGNKIHYSSVVNRYRTGRVCHLIQIKAIALGVCTPSWISKAATRYRVQNGLPMLRTSPKQRRVAALAAAATVDKPKRKYVRRAVKPVTRRHYKRRSHVPAWKKFLRWLAK